MSSLTGNIELVDLEDLVAGRRQFESDTAVAHLAGALGVWVMLKTLPDWRWQVVRTDCPWFPTVRLFRQKVRGLVYTGR